MRNAEIELTAYCGLYCGDCIRYRSKAADLARELISELQNTGFDKYAEIKSGSTKQFGHYEECCGVLEAMSALQCNNPCRVGGGCPTFTCDILKCCRNKKLEGCWQCGEFESCGKFEPLKSIHGDTPRLNLQKIREVGLEKWVGYRSKCYVWQ